MPELIDHIDGDASNNRINNLRPCEAKQNMQNSKIRSDNKTGVKGVSWHKSSGKYRAQFKWGEGKQYCEYFDTIEDASIAITENRKRCHKEFANHG